MQTARRRRTTWAIAASVLAHMAVLVMALLQRPNAPLPIGMAAPPNEQVIQVLLAPRKRPETPRPPATPTQLRLHHPVQTARPPELPAALIAPAAQPATPAARGPTTLHPAPLPEGPRDDLRAALRGGTVGCANRLAVGLNRGELDHCDEALGKGAKDTAFAGLGLAADKRRLLEAAGAKKDRDYRYKHSQIPGAVPDSAPPGESAEAMKDSLGVSGHSATRPF